MRETEFCNHYQAMLDHKECKIGIAYDSFSHLKFDQKPCFKRRGIAPCGCGKAVFPTPEEIEARDKELFARMQKIGIARMAIVEFLGGPWKKGMGGGAGEIPCPNCETGQLQFSRAGYNGHIHAGCTTPECVRWME